MLSASLPAAGPGDGRRQLRRALGARIAVIGVPEGFEKGQHRLTAPVNLTEFCLFQTCESPCPVSERRGMQAVAALMPRKEAGQRQRGPGENGSCTGRNPRRNRIGSSSPTTGRRRGNGCHEHPNWQFFCKADLHKRGLEWPHRRYCRRFRKLHHFSYSTERCVTSKLRPGRGVSGIRSER